MGWEFHGQRRYYTRSRKANGRVVREYIGGGAIGELAAAADALRHVERRIARAARQAEQARLEEALVPSLQLWQVAELVARAELLLAGYHRHDRGKWRRKRHGSDGTEGPANGGDGPGETANAGAAGRAG